MKPGFSELITVDGHIISCSSQSCLRFNPTQAMPISPPCPGEQLFHVSYPMDRAGWRLKKKLIKVLYTSSRIGTHILIKQAGLQSHKTTVSNKTPHALTYKCM